MSGTAIVYGGICCVRALRCPVLRLRRCTRVVCDVRDCAMGLRALHVMCGTKIADAAMRCP
eukprot:1910262-Rhodomonas_salina.1